MTHAPRVLITGAAGQVGRELIHSFTGFGEVIAYSRDQLDLANPDQIRSVIRDVRPGIILNAAAYTAVDRAESEPELAQAINAHAPRILAEEAQRQNALLIHYSTDYVYDGSKTSSWNEDDAPNPLNIYGASKLAGDQAIVETGGKYLIFRTSWVYGPHGRNFLATMLRLGSERDEIRVVDDQYGAPTSSIEIARATRTVAEKLTDANSLPENWAGIYNFTCAGAASWHGFADAIFARSQGLLDKAPPTITKINASEYPVPAKRPQNSVLSNAKLDARFGVQLAPWQDALDEVLVKLREQRKISG